jgi:hypothetical protein
MVVGLLSGGLSNELAVALFVGLFEVGLEVSGHSCGHFISVVAPCNSEILEDKEGVIDGRQIGNGVAVVGRKFLCIAEAYLQIFQRCVWVPLGGQSHTIG